MLRSRSLVILLVLALLVVYTYLGMGYMKQRKEHEVLAAHISEVTKALGEIPKPAGDLDEQLVAAQAGLAAEQGEFPGKLNSTRVINTILSIADDCGVRVTPLVTEPWLTEEVGEHDYLVFRLNIAVEGSFQQMASFVSQLENSELKTLLIEDLSVARADEQPEGEGITQTTVPVSAGLSLTIYTRPPTSD